MKTVLYVGCGMDSIQRRPEFAHNEDWQEIRLDIDASVVPDVVSSMTEMPAVATGSVDVVFSSHNLEHLYPHDVGRALGEFRRVLREDGCVLCLCPDLQSVAALVADGFLEETAYITPFGLPIAPIDILYGLRVSLAQGHKHMAHHCGFTEKSLAQAFLNGGFASVAIRRQRRFLQLAALATVRALPDSDIQDLLKQYIGEMFVEGKP